MNSTTKINCLNCYKEIYVETREIKRGNGKFCGRFCSAQHRAKNLTPLEPNVNCAYCNKKFYKCLSKKASSKSQLYFCCRDHKDLGQRIASGIKEIQLPHYDVASENTYRRIAFTVKPKKCERCEYDAHEAGIVVHHIDRNRVNNDISNLEVLCAICHNIEHWGEVDKN